MQTVRCGGEKCNATYPADAAFCPRCGRRNDRRQIATPTPARWRGPFRTIIGLVIVLMIFRGFLRSRTATPPSVATPALDSSDPIDADVTSALFSLEAFSQARQSWAGSHSERNRFAELVTGRRVRWVGTLQSSWRPGAYNLVSSDRTANASIKMMPATAEAKQQVKQIAPNTPVQVEGVLMDDQWMHLLNVQVVGQ
jgi:hypothetical protein